MSFHQEQRDKQPFCAAISIEEWMNGLKLVMDKRCPYQRVQAIIIVYVFLQI